MANTSEPPKSGDNVRSAVKTDLEIEKLRLETAKLKRDATRYGQLAGMIVPMSVAMITAIVAVVGIVVSVGTFIQQGYDRSADAHDKSLQQALSMATDNGAGSDRRVSGIYQLRDFWANARDEQVVAASLTALLILPDSITGAASVRCAAAEVIGSAYGLPGIVARLPRDDPRVRRIAQLLYGGADGPIGLVSRENYLLRQIQDQQRKVQTGGSSLTRFEDSAIATVGCVTPLAATREC